MDRYILLSNKGWHNKLLEKFNELNLSEDSSCRITDRAIDVHIRNIRKKIPHIFIEHMLTFDMPQFVTNINTKNTTANTRSKNGTSQLSSNKIILAQQI